MKIYESIPENKLPINQTAKKLLTGYQFSGEIRDTYLALLVMEVAQDCEANNLENNMRDVLRETPEKQMKLMLPEYPDIDYEVLNTEGLRPEKAKKEIAALVEYNLVARFSDEDWPYLPSDRATDLW